ncbi:Protocadherin-1 [Fasciola hepatica]|uniref:Protocadherin-1 n=1 Tax=Fasciola hepatica TaxID=6192 RepID=A0A4E0R475_FASHE|nr:Protocadherin-1 [Fasciola hepatica]
MGLYQTHLIITIFWSPLVIPFCIGTDAANGGFQKELTYAINEESEVGSFVGNLKLDAERKFLIPYNQLTRFDLYDDTRQGYFRVEQETGKLFVAARIDREAICPQPDALIPDKLTTYTEDLWSTLPGQRNGDQSGANVCQVHLALHIAQQFWVNVIITIHDINDHKPYFPIGSADAEPSLYTVNISESVTAGYEVPLIGAKDADAGMNSVQTYSLRGAELDPSLFAIAYKPPFTLNLVILRELDAETKSTYHGELVACDGGQPQPLCGAQPFQVFVNDLNDNKPVFTKSLYEVEVEETLPINSTVIRLNATDADSGPRGHVQYLFGQPISQAVHHHFRLDPVTGELITQRGMNARENPRFIIPVVAKDGGLVPLIGQTVVQITVRDVNDHDPWIEIRAVQSVRQQGPQSRSNLTDKNTSLFVSENQPIGTNIGLLIAGDEDVGDNSAVVCHLKSNQAHFYLEHANSAKGREMYRLGTNLSFDREALLDGVVYVDVLCLDGGNPKRSTERKIAIQVLDENEFTPSFDTSQKTQNVYLEEGKPVGTFVIQVRATDEDATPKIEHYLSREAQNLFHIDAESGAITTRVILDREQMPKIRFNVYATDQDQSDRRASPAVANITVHLADINDNAPELTGNRAFHIVENRPGFSDLVGQLTSIDKDVGNNGTVRYSLVSVSGNGNPIANDTFMLNPDSGKLFTLRSLDREQYSQYELVVLLEDRGTPQALNSTATITVDVLDENDNAPVWSDPLRIMSALKYVSIPEALRQNSRMLGLVNFKDLGLLNATTPFYHGQKVTRLTATDPDAPHNANLTYHLLATYFIPFNEEFDLGKESAHSFASRVAPNVPTYFKLSATTGDLFIGPGLGGAGSAKSGLAELYLRVCDNGNPPLDSSARLFVQLTSYNPTSVILDPNNGGFLSYLISTGHLGIALIVVLFVIMCLTSICLVVAFTTIRRKSSGGTCDCFCCPSAQRKALRLSIDNDSVQQNSQFTAEGTGIMFDGRPSAIGRIYQGPKSQSIFPEGASLYKWVPECSFPMGNFGPPPIYNLPLLNSTMDRMHSSHTDSDKSGMALLPCELPCPSTHSQDDRGSTDEHGQDAIIGRCDTQMLVKRPILEANRGAQITDGTKRTDPNLVSSKATGSEIDGGSADSGQGGSEEEALAMDGLRYGFSQLHPLRSFEFPLGRSDLVSISQSGLKISTDASKNDSSSVQNSHCNVTACGSFSTITTFAHTTDQANPRSPKTTPSPPCVLPPPPACIECSRPRWQRPLFTNAEFGHHNRLFEEFPRKPTTQPRQSFTLPPASKVVTSESEKGRLNEYSPLTTRSKVATLSNLPGKQWCQ